MIERKTIIDQIEITRSGRLQIRCAIQLVDGGVELSSKWHRTAVDPGVDPDAQLAAVNAAIALTGEAPIVEDGMPEILRTVVKTVHTPEVIATFQAAQEVIVRSADIT